MDSDHSLLLEPNQVLTFIYTPNTPMTSQIHLKNISSSNLAYKLRTNSPSSYSVRPTQGILAANEAKTITVILQSKEKLPDTTKDKFLILHSTTSLSFNSSLAEINEFWKSIQTQLPTFKSAKLGVIIQKPENAIEVPQIYKPTQKTFERQITLEENEVIENNEKFLTPRKSNSNNDLHTATSKNTMVTIYVQPKLKFLTLMSIMGLALGVFYYVV